MTFLVHVDLHGDGKVVFLTAVSEAHWLIALTYHITAVLLLPESTPGKFNFFVNRSEFHGKPGHRSRTSSTCRSTYASTVDLGVLVWVANVHLFS